MDFHHSLAGRGLPDIPLNHIPWVPGPIGASLNPGGRTRGVFMRRSAPPTPEQQLGVGNGAAGTVSPAYMPKDPPIAHPRMCRDWEVRRG